MPGIGRTAAININFLPLAYELRSRAISATGPARTTTATAGRATAYRLMTEAALWTVGVHQAAHHARERPSSSRILDCDLRDDLR